jgi:small subunit ribosomal protein S6e
MEFKVIISDGGKTYQKEIKGEEAARLVGLRIGEIFDGNLIGESGKLQITGGTDKDGFPMRRGIAGSRRLKILVRGGAGFIPQQAGERRKKMVRGDTVSEYIVQINTKLTTESVKPAGKEKKKEEKIEEEEKVEEISKVKKEAEKEILDKSEIKAKEEKPVKVKKMVEKEKVKKEVKEKKEEKTPEPAKEELKPEKKEILSIPVIEVKGIGKKTADLLAAEGISTVQDLLDTDMDRLAEKTGLSTKQIEKLKTAAQNTEG